MHKFKSFQDNSIQCFVFALHTVNMIKHRLILNVVAHTPAAQPPQPGTAEIYHYQPNDNNNNHQLTAYSCAKCAASSLFTFFTKFIQIHYLQLVFLSKCEKVNCQLQ